MRGRLKSIIQFNFLLLYIADTIEISSTSTRPTTEQWNAIPQPTFPNNVTASMSLSMVADQNTKPSTTLDSVVLLCTIIGIVITVSLAILCVLVPVCYIIRKRRRCRQGRVKTGEPALSAIQVLRHMLPRVSSTFTCTEG